LGHHKKRLWVQTHWCASESHVSLLPLSLTWGCQQLVNHIYYCASKWKIACYLRNLICHSCQVRALQGHYDVRCCFRGRISNKVPWFYVAEGLESMDLRLHSQSIRHKALGRNFNVKVRHIYLMLFYLHNEVKCGTHGSLSVWHFFVHDIHLVINSTHEFLFCVSFNVFVCRVFSGISWNMLFIWGSAHNHLAHILSLKFQVLCMDIMQSHFLQNFMASLNSWVISSSQE